MNLSLMLGTIFASPVIVWHLWGFLSPALYTHEKKVVIPVLVMAVVLFLAGCALSWFVILPAHAQGLRRYPVGVAADR